MSFEFYSIMKEKNLQLISILAVSALLLIPFVATAQDIIVPNPIGAPEASGPRATVIDIVFAGFAGFAGVFGILVFGFMLINAFKLIISHGNEESITKAKQGLTWSVAAFVVAIFAFSLVSAVSEIFGGNKRDELATPDIIAPPIGDAGFVEAFTTFFNGVLTTVVVAATLMLVYAGIKMVVASGNEEQITSAKTIMKWAVVGLIVTGLAFAILNGLDNLFVRSVPA